MGLSVVGFLALLVAVALLRAVELLISRRNQHRLEALGVHRTREPHFHWMVLLHAAVLAGAALEVL
jgi:isoprenylcysteine carboxyl methyltransferase (ICMT) family protein YpbQ